MTKSYKMVVLRALIMSGRLFGPVPLPVLCAASRRLVLRDPRLIDDLRSKEIPAPEHLPDDAFAKYWRRWPVAAWAGELSGADHPWAKVDEDTFALRLAVPEPLEASLTELVSELVDWRLAKYLDARSERGGAVLKVSHAGGRPILFLDRQRNPELPLGSVDVLTPEGDVYELDFVKVAVNVARRGGGRDNRLPDLLRAWFGDDAGHPGTAHQVHLVQDPRGSWTLRPVRGNEPASAVASDVS